MTPSPPEAACWLAGTNFSTHRTDILRIVRSILLNLTNKVYWIRIADPTFTKILNEWQRVQLISVEFNLHCCIISLCVCLDRPW